MFRLVTHWDFSVGIGRTPSLVPAMGTVPGQWLSLIWLGSREMRCILRVLEVGGSVCVHM
jgi:hypothetical protein